MRCTQQASLHETKEGGLAVGHSALWSAYSGRWCLIGSLLSHVGTVFSGGTYRVYEFT